MTRTLLLGAGASAAAGIPVANEMARHLYEDHKHVEPFSRAARVAIAGLKFHRSIHGDDPFAEIDVEDLYETLVVLRDRRDSPIAPFVGAWSAQLSAAEGAIRLPEAARHVARSLQAELIGAARRGRPDIDLREFELALRDALVVSTGAASNIFDEAARFVLEKIPAYCWIRDDSKVAYLNPLLDSARTQPLWIASLNYDNTVELAASVVRVDVDCGIQDGGLSVRFTGEAPITLAKLHGSLDWESRPDGSLRIADVRAGNAALIFGSGNKLQVEGPYLDLLFAFRDRLNETQELKVCGYSFRDRHVNHMILRWLLQKENSRLVVYDINLTPDKLIANINAGMQGRRIVDSHWFTNKLNLRQATIEELIMEW